MWKDTLGNKISKEEYNSSEICSAGQDKDGYYRLCPNSVSKNNNGGWAGPCYNCTFREESGCSLINN